MTGTHRNTNLKIMIAIVLMNANCEILLVLVLVNRENLPRTLSRQLTSGSHLVDSQN